MKKQPELTAQTSRVFSDLTATVIPSACENGVGMSMMKEAYGSYRIFRGGGWADSEKGCLGNNGVRLNGGLKSGYAPKLNVTFLNTPTMVPLV